MVGGAVEVVVGEAGRVNKVADGRVEAIDVVGRRGRWASGGIALDAVEFVVGEVDGLVELADGGVVAGHVVEDGVPYFFGVGLDLVDDGFEIGYACGLLVDKRLEIHNGFVGVVDARGVVCAQGLLALLKRLDAAELVANLLLDNRCALLLIFGENLESLVHVGINCLLEL